MNTLTPVETMLPDELAEELARLTGAPLSSFDGDSTATLRRKLTEAREDAARAEAEAAPAPAPAVVTASVDEERIAIRVAERIAKMFPSLSGTPDAVKLPEKFSPPSVLAEYKCPEPELWTGIAALASMETLDAEPVNVMLKGPTGTGKTTFAGQFAANNVRPVFVVDCSLFAEPDQLFFTVGANKGTVTVQPAALVEALDAGCDIVWDEVNRFTSYKVANALLPLADKRRRVWVEELGRYVERKLGTVWFATMNEGYSGTDLIDAALFNRFTSGTSIGYLSIQDEADAVSTVTGLGNATAVKLTTLAANLRGLAPVSLRQCYTAANLILSGLNFRTAIRYTIGVMDGLDWPSIETTGRQSIVDWDTL